MIAQILGFSALFIMVFGGVIGAIVKFTLSGVVQTKVSSRVPEEKIDSVLEETNMISTDKTEKSSHQSMDKNMHKTNNNCNNEKNFVW